MKDLSNYTLRQLEVLRQKQGNALVLETSQSSRENRIPCYEPILEIINKIEEILKKRTGPSVRNSLSKKRQRQLGLLPSLNSSSN